MPVAYQSTCQPTIGPPLSVDILTDISVECQSTYRPMLDRHVSRYIERHISVDISTDTRPTCQPTYRSTLGRYVDQYIGQLSVDMSTDISVEGCSKYTWSKNTPYNHSMLQMSASLLGHLAPKFAYQIKIIKVWPITKEMIKNKIIKPQRTQ